LFTSSSISSCLLNFTSSISSLYFISFDSKLFVSQDSGILLIVQTAMHSTTLNTLSSSISQIDVIHNQDIIDFILSSSLNISCTSQTFFHHLHIHIFSHNAEIFFKNSEKVGS